ncbi:MAG: nucleotide kinase domain-containing protein [Thermoplasmatota archaeon]
MKSRKNVENLYWYFASERQKIFNARAENLRGPWTEDPILQQYKFCNVFRASDRVSQYMIRDVCYDEYDSIEDQVFNTLAFRFFSKPETWNKLKAKLGGQIKLQHLESGEFENELGRLKRTGQTMYTSAFILCATKAYGHSEKFRNHVELFKHMFLDNGLGKELPSKQSLESIVETLREYPLMGDFMSYQVAIDLNYLPQINFSENDYVVAGPGALRGIRKAFPDVSPKDSVNVIRHMVESQDEKFEEFGYEFQGLWGRKLHAIDCQGLFCELDKYTREAMPELKSARKRIKAKYSPRQQPFQLFFPPKWGINDKIPGKQAFGDPGVQQSL